MKKRVSKYMFILAVVPLFLYGCSVRQNTSATKIEEPFISPTLNSETKQFSKTESSASVVNQTNHSQPEITLPSANQNISVKTALYNDMIAYPVFSDTPNNISINESILNRVKELNDSYNFDLNTKMDFKVTTEREFISIVFFGEFYNGAYPRKIRSTFNLNPNNGSQYALKEMVKLDNKSLSVIRDYTNEKVKELGTTYEEQFSIPFNTLIEEGGTSIYSEVQHAFDNQSLLLFISVRHALGDYIEISIPISELEVLI